MSDSQGCSLASGGRRRLRPMEPRTCSAVHAGAALTPCASCGAKTAALPDSKLRLRCALCGGPKLPAGAPETAEVRELLLTVRKSASAARVASTLSSLAVATSLAPCASVLLIPLHGLGAAAAVVSALVLLAGAVIGLRVRNAHAVRLEDALDGVWAAAAEGMLESSSDTTWEGLRCRLGLEGAEAKRVAARLASRACVTVRIDASAVMSFRRMALDHSGRDELPDDAAPRRRAAVH